MKGLYDLIRRDPDGEYLHFVVGLAEYLDEVAAAVVQPVGPRVDYDAAQPLFGHEDEDEGAGGEGNRDGPGLLLVDPWIVLDPVASAAVAAFDKTRKS